jgi:hypothetical protein
MGSGEDRGVGGRRRGGLWGRRNGRGGCALVTPRRRQPALPLLLTLPCSGEGEAGGCGCESPASRGQLLSLPGDKGLWGQALLEGGGGKGRTCTREEWRVALGHCWREGKMAQPLWKRLVSAQKGKGRLTM